MPLSGMQTSETKPWDYELGILARARLPGSACMHEGFLTTTPQQERMCKVTRVRERYVPGQESHMALLFQGFGTTGQGVLSRAGAGGSPGTPPCVLVENFIPRRAV